MSKGRRPSGVGARTILVLLFAVFAATVGYGVALPVLPHVVESLSPASRASVGRHTGLLTAVYAGAPLLFAPLWGWWSDRQGRRTVLLIGLGGFSATLALSAFAPDLAWLYGARFLNGAFAAAILPTAQALVADLSVSETWRARRFAWIGMASIAGFFTGPMLGTAVLQLGDAGPDAMPPAQLLALPFLLSAGLAALGAVGVLAVGAAPRSMAAPPYRAPNRRRVVVPQLLLLAAIVAGGIAAFEVGLALRGQTLGMEPYQVGIMFAECSLIMFAAQAVVFSPLVAPATTARLIAPALAVLGVGLVLVPYAGDFATQIVAVGAVAASAGILMPILTYWLSRSAGAAQGAQLGRQAAATSLGQTMGSAGAGILFGLAGLPDLGLLLPAALTLIAAAASLGLPRLLSADAFPDHPALAAGADRG